MMNRRNTLRALLVCGLVATLSQSAIAGGYYYRHHGGHHGHGDGAALAAGLIIGGLFGYLISEDRHSHRHYDHTHYRATAYPRTHVVTVPVERTPIVVRVAQDSEFAGHDCMMTREYTTTISIDGVDKEAYGTRCMTAEGGWILGQPKLMPELQD